MALLRTPDLDPNTIMESVNDSPILHLSVELQIDCFSALGEVDGSLLDAFNMALTNKKLYAIYKKHHQEIGRHIITRSNIHAYDILLSHLFGPGKKMTSEVSPDSWPELSHNVQDFTKSMLPRSITSDDVGEAQGLWEWSGKARQKYLKVVSEYQSSPFPYRWNFATRSSIIPSDESMVVRGRCVDWTPLDPSSFKSRFHKALVRWKMLKTLLIAERDVGSNFSWIYREWFDKISNRDERWSFLECLDGLELNDYYFGFHPWVVDTPLNKGDRDHLRKTSWREWYDDLEMMSVREQAGIIEYPDLADRALEPPESFKRLISSEVLDKDLEIDLMQAWPSFRRNWPQTARCMVFNLHDSREALAKIKEWMEAGSGTERVLLEDSGRSSLQEWLVGFVDL